MKREKFTKLSFAALIFIIAAILSTLLIFVIDLWIVLIINACEIILYRILFMKLTMPKWLLMLLYIVVCSMSLGIIVLVMYYPEKICGGTMQNISDMEYIKKYFGEKYLIESQIGTKPGFLWSTPVYGFTGIKSAELIRGYHIGIGILSILIIVRYIYFGANLFYMLFKRRPEKLSISFFPVISLESLGGLIIANLSWHFTGLIAMGFGYGAIIDIVEIIIFYVKNPDYWDRSNSGSGNSKTYHVFIVED